MGLAPAIGICILLCGACEASAGETQNPRQRARLKAGLGAYEQLRYRRAVDLLQQALGDPLDPQERATALRTLAVCHVALDETRAAREDFARLLETDRAAQLDRTVAPRVRALFDDVKRSRVTPPPAPPPPAPPALLPVLAPKSLVEGRPLTMSVDVPGARPRHVLLYFRTRGQDRWSRMALTDALGGRYDAMLPGPDVKSPALEYYMVALDGAGAAVGEAGARDLPLTAPVAQDRRPFYKSPWFWGVVGGVVVAGAAGTAAGVAIMSARHGM